MTASNGETPARTLASLPAACPRCEYDLSGSAGEICPECGGDIAAEASARGGRKEVRWILGPLLIGLLGWGYGSFSLVSMTVFYTGKLVEIDPISIGVHGMTLLNAAGVVSAMLFRREIRRMRPVPYNTLGAAAALQAGVVILIWLMMFGR